MTSSPEAAELLIVEFEPARLPMQKGDEEAALVRVGGRLAAVLVKLTGTKDEELENTWFLQSGFGPWDEEGLTFQTLDRARVWIWSKLLRWQPMAMDELVAEHTSEPRLTFGSTQPS